MQVSFNNFSFNIPKIATKGFCAKPAPCGADTFVRSSAPSFSGRDGWIDIVGNKKDAMSKERYNALSEDEKDLLRAQVKSFGYVDKAAETVKAATKLKESFDKEYGEGKWTYVSIGRSCAVVARALELMGEDAKSIPISGLSHGIDHGSELLARRGFEDYKKHIHSLGLDPQTVANSGKTYIFEDYSSSGNSLKRFEEFLKTDEMGLDLENVKFESINKRMENIFHTMSQEELAEFNPLAFVCMRLGMQHIGIKQQSSLPQLDHCALYNISHCANQAPCAIANLFEFGLLNEMNS